MVLTQRKRTQPDEECVESVKQLSLEREEDSQEKLARIGPLDFCKQVSLKNTKANLNDPVSLLVQTCESKLNCRPGIDYE